MSLKVCGTSTEADRFLVAGMEDCHLPASWIEASAHEAHCDCNRLATHNLKPSSMLKIHTWYLFLQISIGSDTLINSWFSQR